MVSPSTASTFTTAAANVSHMIIGVKPRSKRQDFLVTQMIKSQKIAKFVGGSEILGINIE